MKIEPLLFHISKNSDSSIFSTCFALFVYDLFNEINDWSGKVINEWIDYINSFQDINSGYFSPTAYNGNFDVKTIYQLTAFCLSALNIFNASPKYQLSFLNQWKTSKDVNNYLTNNGCLSGVPGSGNMAMFLTIFLTYKYKYMHDDTALDLLNEWFSLHNDYQNKNTGFWGSRILTRYYWGFQNALHQIIVYDYWNKEIHYKDHIIDNILKMQNIDGHFSMIPGGGACWDYDAVHILLIMTKKNEYRLSDVKQSLEKLYESLINSINDDGGFCESNSICDIIKNKKSLREFIFYGNIPYIWYSRIKTTLPILIKKNYIYRTNWVKSNLYYNKSDLWNTWFKCLTIAEIETFFQNENSNNIKNGNWNFHKFIGLGYNSLKEKNID